jgi:hypothetical protein
MTTRYLPLAAAILLYAVSAHAGTTGDFDLVNETGHTIVGVAVSTPSDNRWHPIQGD